MLNKVCVGGYLFYVSFPLNFTYKLLPKIEWKQKWKEFLVTILRHLTTLTKVLKEAVPLVIISKV